VCTAPDPYLTWTAFITGGGSANDNCDVDTLTFEWVTDVSDGQTNPETITRYYRIEDICGNADTCTQTIVLNELEINAYVYLEGAAINPAGTATYTIPMRHTLNTSTLKVLPGQTYKVPILGTIVFTPAGQPYNIAPWNYAGAEGTGYNSFGVLANGQANYPTNAVDWVLVSLRATPNGGPVCQTAAILLDDGTIDFVEGGFSCCDIDLSISYYMVIEHRNHLIIMSQEPIPFVGGTITYDFRINQSYVDPDLGFGSAQKFIPNGVYVMYAGNGDQSSNPNADTDITLNDRFYWEGQNNTAGRYRNGDYNLNGDCNYNDRITYEFNNGNTSAVPR
jgi:hypothetical protein